MSKKIRIRMQGVAFLVVLALLLGLSIATYQKAFTEVARVTLETDTAGNQLQEASDVKVRGVIVGDVREVNADADGATIELAINPEYLDQIPADVSARVPLDVRISPRGRTNHGRLGAAADEARRPDDAG